MGRVQSSLLFFVTFLIVFLSISTLTECQTRKFGKFDESVMVDGEKPSLFLLHKFVHGLGFPFGGFPGLGFPFPGLGFPGFPGLGLPGIFGGLPLGWLGGWGGFPGGFFGGRGGYFGGRGGYPGGYPGGRGGYPGGPGGYPGGRGGYPGGPGGYPGGPGGYPGGPGGHGLRKSYASKAEMEGNDEPIRN